jgi:hypothetical protein
LVKSGNFATAGSGTSVPHLKGSGALLSETKSSVKAEGAALESPSVPDEPVSSVPLAKSTGGPATPARLLPSSTQAEGSSKAPMSAIGAVPEPVSATASTSASRGFSARSSVVPGCSAALLPASIAADALVRLKSPPGASAKAGSPAELPVPVPPKPPSTIDQSTTVAALT